MQNMYDVAGLAIVAYAEVLADGTSPNTNSGVTTAKSGTGQYTVTLPANKTQNDSRDLVLVTPKVIPATGEPWSHSVDDSDPAIKRVAIYGGSPISTFADAQFSVLVLRTIIPPPAGSPA